MLSWSGNSKLAWDYMARLNRKLADDIQQQKKMPNFAFLFLHDLHTFQCNLKSIIFTPPWPQHCQNNKSSILWWHNKSLCGAFQISTTKRKPCPSLLWEVRKRLRCSDKCSSCFPDGGGGVSKQCSMQNLQGLVLVNNTRSVGKRWPNTYTAQNVIWC